MSEITRDSEKKANELYRLFMAVMHQKDAFQTIHDTRESVDNAVAHDIIALADRLMQEGHPLPQLKQAMNKFLNVLGDTLRRLPGPQQPADSLSGVMMQNNEELIRRLADFKPVIRQLNHQGTTPELWDEARRRVNELATFEAYYTLKENVLFPAAEAHWPDFRCIQMMWSFHDEIRADLKTLEVLLQEPTPDLGAFNKSIGSLFFNLYNIKLRDEKILLPYMEATIPADTLDKLLSDCHDPEFPFVKAPKNTRTNKQHSFPVEGKINLGTGYLDASQLILLFEHLPVDITFVDAQDKVCYYSSPPHRIFPRSRAVIGRDVHLCHPPESVHVVHRIVEAFRSGKRDVASFWIDMKGRKILIQYFALRNEKNEYQGVIEVSQDISFHRSLEGQQRLLDWE